MKKMKEAANDYLVEDATRAQTIRSLLQTADDQCPGQLEMFTEAQEQRDTEEGDETK